MYVCVGVWYTHATTCVWRSENKSEGFGPPLPPYGSQESNSGYQGWLQALLPTEPSHWTLNDFKVRKIRNLKFDINNQAKENKHICSQLSCKSISTWQLHWTAQLKQKCVQTLDHSCMAPCPRPPPLVIFPSRPQGSLTSSNTAEAFRYLSLLS